MTIPSLSVSAASPHEAGVDVVVFGVGRGPDGPVVLADPALADSLLTALGDLSDLGLTGARDDFARVPAVAAFGARGVALVGVGAITADEGSSASDETPGPNELRYAAGVAARRLSGAASVGLALPMKTEAHVSGVLEGAGIGAYEYTEYRSEASLPKKRVANSFVALTSTPVTSEAIAAAAEIARAVHTVRDLVNAPALDLYPESFAERTVGLARDIAGVTVETWDEGRLVEEGFGGIVGVGQGSARPPRLVKVSYQPDASERHIALVGKGITFDSGGLSLKPPVPMIGMKYDMTGAATVLAVVLAAARLQLPVRVTAWLCLAENMPSATAIRPGDVLRIRGGRTVEVLNTDAEGRLVLADGLVAASEEHPDAIIDVATLTGAAIVALGNRYVGTMGSDELVALVEESALRVGEPFWRMPLAEELRPLLNSDIADLANVKPGNTAGGMLIAGVFLSEFVGESADGSSRIPWAHLDIAGAAHNKESGYGYTGTGPTGVTVRTLLDVIAPRG